MFLELYNSHSYYISTKSCCADILFSACVALSVTSGLPPRLRLNLSLVEPYGYRWSTKLTIILCHSTHASVFGELSLFFSFALFLIQVAITCTRGLFSLYFTQVFHFGKHGWIDYNFLSKGIICALLALRIGNSQWDLITKVALYRPRCGIIPPHIPLPHLKTSRAQFYSCLNT